MGNPFAIGDTQMSHAHEFNIDRFSFMSEEEPSGQLVLCQSGEIELSSHDGEWIIPAGYMVFIPQGRMFRIKAKIPTQGLSIRFCRNEVSWNYSGCWVGQANDIVEHLANYSLKWSHETESATRKARAFFTTLGDMVPGWFQGERIMWTPYAENAAIQKVIDFAKQRGPWISLPEVAEHVGMSERTLRRHMQSELGQSWRSFIREMRMNKAMELLRRERKSVTETAFEVGFASSSAFSNAFLEHVGQSPSAYAKTTRIRAERVAH